jgi:hypothetical protein
MRPLPVVVVGGWAAANLGLALILFAFHPEPLEALVHLGSTALITGFGLLVLLAVRIGRVGTQLRQPRSAGTAVFAGLGLALVLTGVTYDWWLSVLGFYPFLLAVWLARGERLPRGARPWPVALDGAELAGPPRLVRHGGSLGVALPAAGGSADSAPPGEIAPEPVPEPPQPSGRLRTAILVVLLVTAARAVREVLKGRRR